MHLVHGGHESRALGDGKRLEETGRGPVRAPVHLPHLPPPRRRQARGANPPVAGRPLDPEQAFALERRYQPTGVSGIEAQAAAEVAQVRSGRADLVEHPGSAQGPAPAPRK